ncbi:MAG: ectoine synthase [Methanothrix sp.]|mgnify:CR=1 FL=1|jgi:ectoine synthase (EC 4.2.1.108)|uniref:L-ectoine synthase n=1 Tax=Methanothrix harundinacea TaxID=301375 RepID=A0A117LFG7_9EURY|nr:MAG: L-ectoine synthase [Methanosaeta sp. SDB]KUK44261.1 MAG: Ectoine synthase [Methanothrix harundinacea]MDD3710698.1 ectoine synthase [Methanothrix sp.]MDI9399802.1 ectoine synthase [Euryarchaeota archaeon]KUK96323.1 MAG: Ectoine synthase [Methanothrix harundinacea]
MIVRNLLEAEKTDRRVVAENWESTRLLLKGDGMGFSFHITTIYPGTETHIWYKNHLESVYCIEGEGEVEVLEGMAGDERVDGGNIGDRREGDGEVELERCGNGGKIYKIAPGTIYVLDQHDRHLLRAKTPLKLACVFNPPLHGKEVHDENGVYPLEGDEVAD